MNEEGRFDRTAGLGDWVLWKRGRGFYARMCAGYTYLPKAGAYSEEYAAAYARNHDVPDEILAMSWETASARGVDLGECGEELLRLRTKVEELKGLDGKGTLSCQTNMCVALEIEQEKSERLREALQSVQDRIGRLPPEVRSADWLMGIRENIYAALRKATEQEG